MRNKFVNFYSLKNPCFGIQQTLGKHFLPPAGCGSIFPTKSCWGAWRSGSQLERSNKHGRWGRTSQPNSFNSWRVGCMVPQLSVVENRALSIDQSWLLGWQFSLHRIDFLGILLRCNGFARILKAVMVQTGNRPPNSDHYLFLVQVWLWSFFLV